MIRRPPRSTLFPYTTLFRSKIANKTPTNIESPKIHKGLYTAVFAISIPLFAISLDKIPWKINPNPTRSEEHTSELQSRQYLVCRLLLEKKKKQLTTKSKTIT